MVPHVGVPHGGTGPWRVVTAQWDTLMWARRVPVGSGDVEREDGRKVRVPESSRRLMLLVLASRLNRQGRCWPTLRMLSKDSGLSLGQTQRAVQSLVDDGWVGRTLRGPRSPVYILAVGRSE